MLPVEDCQPVTPSSWLHVKPALFTDLNCILLNQYGYTLQIKWQPVFSFFFSPFFCVCVFSWPNTAWNVYFWTWCYLSMLKKTYSIWVVNSESYIRVLWSLSVMSDLHRQTTALRPMRGTLLTSLLCNCYATCPLPLPLYFFFSIFLRK